MEGPVSDRGVNLRALATVMELSASSMEDFTTVVRVSMLEVYNEKIKYVGVTATTTAAATATVVM